MNTLIDWTEFEHETAGQSKAGETYRIVPSRSNSEPGFSLYVGPEFIHFAKSIDLIKQYAEGIEVISSVREGEDISLSSSSILFYARDLVMRDRTNLMASAVDQEKNLAVDRILDVLDQEINSRSSMSRAA